MGLDPPDWVLPCIFLGMSIKICKCVFLQISVRQPGCSVLCHVFIIWGKSSGCVLRDFNYYRPQKLHEGDRLPEFVSCWGQNLVRTQLFKRIKCEPDVSTDLILLINFQLEPKLLYRQIAEMTAWWIWNFKYCVQLGLLSKMRAM